MSTLKKFQVWVDKHLIDEHNQMDHGHRGGKLPSGPSAPVRNEASERKAERDKAYAAASKPQRDAEPGGYQEMVDRDTRKQAEALDTPSLRKAIRSQKKKAKGAYDRKLTILEDTLAQRTAKKGPRKPAKAPTAPDTPEAPTTAFSRAEGRLKALTAEVEAAEAAFQKARKAGNTDAAFEAHFNLVKAKEILADHVDYMRNGVQKGELVIGKYDTSSLEVAPGKKDNWIEAVGGDLPSFVRAIAHALEREKGMPRSRAIAVAIGTVKRWAAGGGNVKPDTRAKAAKAVAEWTALKAKAAAK